MSESSSISPSTKIKCLIDMALNNEISWLTLNSLIDNLAPTFERSKEVIKIILKEFQEFQCKQYKTGDPGEKVESLIPNEEQEHQLTSRDNLDISLDEDYLKGQEYNARFM